jgi:uncharacterized protein YgfB (UPF0149 family)
MREAVDDLHARVTRALERAACDLDAAECHGVLCGVCCSGVRNVYALWLDYLRGADELSRFAHAEVEVSLRALESWTRDGLARDDFDFVLLLPDDNAALDERVAAFAAWCRGFLAGLGTAGIACLDGLGEDAREFIADLARFGALGGLPDGDEDDEHALTELVEYTRMGVLLVCTELAGW